MSLLQGTNLRKTYRLSRRSSVEALRGVDVAFPEMGDSVAEGTVLEWHKQVGEQVSEGEAGQRRVLRRRA